MSTSSGYLNCCPEAPSSIVLLQTSSVVDGAVSMFRSERFTIGLGTVTADSTGAYVRMALAYQPISPASITLFKNGVQQRLGVDWAVVGKTIVLVDAAVASDDFTIKYFSSTQVSPDSSDIGVGTLVGFDYGTDTALIPEGWLPCDGTTSLTIATYPALYAFATVHSLVLSFTATAFVLKSLTVTLYNGATLVAVPAIIKA